MRKCNYCNVNIMDDYEQCPLCGGVVEFDEPGDTTYPDIMSKTKALNLALRIITFSGIVASAILLSLDRMFDYTYHWAYIAIAAIVYAVFVIRLVEKEALEFWPRVFWIVAGAEVLLIVADYNLGWKRWSVNTVLPIIVLVVQILLLVVMIVNRKNWQSYIMVQIAIIFFDFIPCVLAYFDIYITYRYLTWNIWVVTVMFFLGMIILGGRTAGRELYRRFHIK